MPEKAEAREIEAGLRSNQVQYIRIQQHRMPLVEGKDENSSCLACLAGELCPTSKGQGLGGQIGLQPCFAVQPHSVWPKCPWTHR